MRRTLGISIALVTTLPAFAAPRLGTPRDLPVHFRDRGGSPVAMTAAEASPRSLASADFDEDGLPDIVAGLAEGGRGSLAVFLADADAVYPFEPAARRRRAEDHLEERAVSPLRLDGTRIDLPAVPDALGSGDFDNDGHMDLLVASEGGRTLDLLRGDGRGGFAEPVERRLTGRISRMVVGEINRADGLADIAVAVERGGRSEILVFESPEGAWKAEPETLGVETTVNFLGLGDLDGDLRHDLIAGVDHGLLVIRGRDRMLSLSARARATVPPAVVEQHRLDFTPVRAQVGRFGATSAPMLAILGDDGGLRLGGAGAIESSRIVADGRGSGLILGARLGGGVGEELVTLDAAGTTLRSLAVAGGREHGAHETREESVPLATRPLAALPLRLDPGARDAIVLLNDGGPSLLSIVPPALPTTYTVTTIADFGPGSLRQAILSANANAGLDTIQFNITPNALLTITPITPLPDVTDPVIIDATTQPGYAGTPIVELDGSVVPPSTSGLVLRAGQSVVRGLDLHGFPGSGIVIDGAGHNLVEGNFIGLDRTGTSAIPNQDSGVVIRDSHLNTIGGTAAPARNVISGNAQTGVAIRGPSQVEQEYPSQGAAVAICDLCTVSMPIVIGDEKLIEDLNVRVSLTHTWDGDLVLTLVAPDSTRVALARQRGGSGDNYTGTLFDDGAATPIGAGVPPFGGSYIPEEPLSILNGRSLAGTWTLEVSDTATGDSGALLSWSLGTEGETIWGNVVQGNLIGTDVTGTVGIGNTKGVVIDQSPQNLVGGTVPGARNVIAGGREQASGHGVEISGWPALNALHNQVLGNYIGTDITGMVRLPNLGSGIEVSYADGCEIGGTAALARNLISGNATSGVHTQVSSFDRIQGNFIGTDVTGTHALTGPSGSGVWLDYGTANALVGGSVAAARNLVSGNGTGIVTRGNLPYSTSNAILGNYVGTDLTGTQAVPNAYHGLLADSPFVQVGGSGPGEGNLVSGNNSDPLGWAGVALHPGCESCLVQGNIIGLDRTGTVPLGNDRGLLVNGGPYDLYGGSNPGEGNIIAGNRTHGIWIFDATGNVLSEQDGSLDTPKAIPDLTTTTSTIMSQTTSLNLLVSIKVGVNLGHSFDSDLILTLIAPNGARITLANRRGSAGDNYLNTTFDDGAGTPVAQGVAPFSGSFQPEEPLSALSGIGTGGPWTLEIADVAGGDFGTLADWNIEFDYMPGRPSNYQAQILGNAVGTNAGGMSGLGNGGDGIFGERSDMAQIGMPGAPNVISGNAGRGIFISSPFCAANVIQSNLIGLKRDGVTPLGNGGDGIAVNGPAGIIGGTASAYGNIIAWNGGAGVNVAGDAHVRQTTIRANSIHDNGGLGIDLAPVGVNFNDAGDIDLGANLRQNFPSITSIVPSFMNSLLINGALQSRPNSKYAIDVYGTPQADPSGYGEGRVFLGSSNVVTDGNGNASFTVLTQNGPVGLISATATDFAGNTSEFSGLATTPQEASPARDMQVAVGPGSSVQIAYTPACGATDHVLYWGAAGPGSIGAGGMTWTSAACGLGTSGSANVLLGNPPVGQVYYFVIAGQNGSVEGSYGQDSGGIERAESTLPVICDRPQFLGGACF